MSASVFDRLVHFCAQRRVYSIGHICYQCFQPPVKACWFRATERNQIESTSLFTISTTGYK